MKNNLLPFLSIFLFANIAYGQFHSPNVNGTIAAGEYGTHTDGQNQQTNGGTVWYMTWDATNLYIGITGANTSEAAVVYLDFDCPVPINSGTNANGTIVGNAYDNTNFAELQFRADAVVYVKNTYREYRTSDGSGGWSGATSGFGSYNESGGNVREVAIPWSGINSGIPSCFTWFGYVTTSGGFVYGTVPTENAGGSIGTSARYERYYMVTSTANGAATKPFSRNCYVFNSTSDNNSFGAISVFDFTMNTSGRQISRGTTNGDWTIANDLVVNNGTVFFGSGAGGGNYGTTNISGDLIVSGGTLDMDETDEAMNVSEDVLISSGAVLELSTSAGGDLKVGDLFDNDGTFTCNDREVEFNGSAAQQITGDNAITIDFLEINNASGLTLGREVSVDNQLTLTNGNIILGSNNLILSASATVSGTPSSSKMVITNGSGFLRKLFSANGSFTFPIGDNTTTLEYTPVSINNVSGTAYAGGAYIQAKVIDAKHPSNTSSTDFLTRYWTAEQSGITLTSYDISATYNESGDVNGTEANLVMGKHNGSSWSSVGTVNAGSDLLSGTGLTGFSDFTGGEAAVFPVELSDFSGRVKNNQTILTWATYSESHNDYFQIQRSPDSKTWENIGRVNGNGNSFELINYQFIDNRPLTGFNYYRLQQVDFDGHFEYSNVISVKFIENTGISIYPNPVLNELTVTFDTENEEGLSAEIYSATGQLLEKISVQPNQSKLQLDVSHLAKGSYTLMIKNLRGSMTGIQKFVK